MNGAPGAIPTRDLPLRRRTLYATELREHIDFKLADGSFECPDTSLEFSLIVSEQRRNLVTLETFATLQEAKLDHER